VRYELLSRATTFDVAPRGYLGNPGPDWNCKRPLMSPSLGLRRDPLSIAKAAGLTVVFTILRLGAPLARAYLRFSARNRPSSHGFRIVAEVPDDSNRELFVDRLSAALAFLAASAPIHLRWLRRRYELLVLADVRGGGWFTHVPDVGLLRIHPQLTWRVAPEALAVELAGAAAHGRLCKRILSWSQPGEARLKRLEDRERVWVARRLPSPGALGKDWHQFLVENREREGPRA
jgi:hypothetical protein